MRGNRCDGGFYSQQENADEQDMYGKKGHDEERKYKGIVGKMSKERRYQRLEKTIVGESRVEIE